MRHRTFFSAVLAGVCAALPVEAGQMVLAGASRGADSNYAFVGAVLPVLDGQVGAGPALRVWGDYLDYSYVGGRGRVTAAGWGGALAGVYQFSGEWGWSSVSAGVIYRNTHLSTFDPGNFQRGSHAYANIEADGGFNLDLDWRLRGYASYVPNIHGYMVQGGIDRAVLPDLRLGASVMLQGDKNYHQTSAGVSAFLAVSPSLELAPTVGLSQSGGKSGAYGGLVLILVTN